MIMKKNVLILPFFYLGVSCSLTPTPSSIDKQQSTALMVAAKQSFPSRYSKVLSNIHHDLDLSNLDGTKLERDGETIKVSFQEVLFLSDTDLADEITDAIVDTLNKHGDITLRVTNHGSDNSTAKGIYHTLVEAVDNNATVNFYDMKLVDAKYDNYTKRGKKKNQRIELVFFPY